MSDKPIQNSIRDILTDSDQYIIPMYQRNYAWEEDEITQLIQDIIDSLPAEGDEPKNYYIGTLVVFKRKDQQSTNHLFETIDGQQRLTTLLLIASYLNHKRIAPNKIPDGKLRFDSREKSSYTLNLLLENNYKDAPEELLDLKKTNHAILNGYQLIAKNLENKGDNDLNKFAKFLFDDVQIIRVKVPDDTDLNHYFEIMNNRGEQLEKHEILKAHLLKSLKGISSTDEMKAAERCLHTVWESCSNMEKYVQMGFNTELRSQIFGTDWASFIPKDFDDLADHFEVKEEGQQQVKKDVSSLENIIDTAKQIIDKEERKPGDDPPERFHPPVNFPNFLLHVLRVLTKENIPLDDKRLIPTFKEYLIERGPEKVKEFTYALLRCKWLFDHYIIKREFSDGTDEWSLKHLKRSQEQSSAYYRNTFKDSAENHRILTLLTAFHVSSPTMAYKHWLSAALHYLFENLGTVESNTYLTYLESVARAFVFDRHLTTKNKKDYYGMIYQNDGICHTNYSEVSTKSLKPLLSFGIIENNLIFNYLDYLLWLKHKNESGKKIADFKFTFRSSVEHYYPQNPENIPRMDAADLNAFGNLSLISHSKNSRLSNLPPAAKKSDYEGDHTPIDSIKQHLMMEETPWDKAAIKDHGEAMIDTLIESLKSNQS
jgi:hypothetical protein